MIHFCISLPNPPPAQRGIISSSPSPRKQNVALGIKLFDYSVSYRLANLKPSHHASWTHLWYVCLHIRVCAACVVAVPLAVCECSPWMGFAYASFTHNPAVFQLRLVFMHAGSFVWVASPDGIFLTSIFWDIMRSLTIKRTLWCCLCVRQTTKAKQYFCTADFVCQCDFNLHVRQFFLMQVCLFSICVDYVTSVYIIYWCGNVCHTLICLNLFPICLAVKQTKTFCWFGDKVFSASVAELWMRCDVLCFSFFVQ